MEEKMTYETILIWLIGSCGVIIGVLAMDYWLNRWEARKREYKLIIRRLKEMK